eukprot:2768334-Rhodomonas_salina.1
MGEGGCGLRVAGAGGSCRWSGQATSSLTRTRTPPSPPSPSRRTDRAAASLRPALKPDRAAGGGRLPGSSGSDSERRLSHPGSLVTGRLGGAGRDSCRVTVAVARRRAQIWESLAAAAAAEQGSDSARASRCRSASGPWRKSSLTTTDLGASLSLLFASVPWRRYQGTLASTKYLVVHQHSTLGQGPEIGIPL